MKKISFMKCKMFVTYVKKYLVLIKTMKNVFKRYHKVRHHCHYTGEFREAAHSICNLRYKAPKKIPLVFHNGLHMIITS